MVFPKLITLSNLYNPANTDGPNVVKFGKFNSVILSFIQIYVFKYMSLIVVFGLSFVILLIGYIKLVFHHFK